MEKLTENQKEKLKTLIRFFERENYFPSVQEISAEWKVTRKAAHDTLKVLEAKGFIETSQKARTGKILSDWYGRPYEPKIDTRNLIALPVVGDTVAGLPILAEENITGYVVLTRSMRRNLDGCFILRVKGDSMRDAHIIDGDFLIVKKQSIANDGDIVVARIADESTVKYFHHTTNKIVLKPANNKYHPIEVTNGAFTLEGLVVGLIRIN